MVSRSVSKRNSGQWRARYRDDAGKEHAKHFKSKTDARRWLQQQTPQPELAQEKHSAADAAVTHGGFSGKAGMTALYRHFDANGTLLYVGITNNVHKRTKAHMSAADWFADVARSTVTYYASRTAAIAAEHIAVEGELPLHNVLLQRKDSATSRLESPLPEAAATSAANPHGDYRVRILRTFSWRAAAERAAATACAMEPDAGWRAIPVLPAARVPRWGVVRWWRPSDADTNDEPIAVQKIAVAEVQSI